MSGQNGTAPAIEGSAPRTTEGRVSFLSLSMLVGPLLATALLLSLSVGNATTTSRPETGSGARLTLVTSGLLTDEPFATPEADRTFEDRFELDPLAPAALVGSEVGARGLEVSVRDHPGWEGYFAVTHDFYPAGSVFHVDMEALPPVLDGGGIGEAVFAVQTGSTKITSDVNFVTVNTYTRDGALKWQVGYSAGKFQDAKRTALAQVEDPPAPLVPDHPVGVTLRTDGYHRLSVHLDDTEVLDATDLDMEMEPPLQAYLEVQAKGVAYTARFTDFWVTASDTVRLDGLPAGTAVRIGEPGAPLATATADDDGTAAVVLPLPRAHGRAPLAVQVPGATDWKQLSASLEYSGGDVYRVELTPTGSDGEGR